MEKNTTKVIERKDLVKVFLRGILLQLSWNYERMQALGYCYAILPALKKLYKNDPERLKEAVARNLEFFNTQPYMAMPIIGTTLAMEERLATHNDIEGSAISSVKVSMMGPLAGIGDSLFWFTVFPICVGVGISMSENGSILGPIVFLVLFNVFNLGTRYFGTVKGYEVGTGFIQNVGGSSAMQRLSEAATIVGLMVLGTMSATMISMPLDFVIGQGESAMTLQAIFDGVMPNLMPLLVTLLVYWLMKKKQKSATFVLVSIILASIALTYIGLFV